MTDDIWLQFAKIFFENRTMHGALIIYSQVYRLDLYIYFCLSMQKYHQEHANRAVTNKITSELVSAEESIYLRGSVRLTERDRESDRQTDRERVSVQCVHREM
jgi:hypothetical protein